MTTATTGLDGAVVGSGVGVGSGVWVADTGVVELAGAVLAVGVATAELALAAANSPGVGDCGDFDAAPIPTPIKSRTIPAMMAVRRRTIRGGGIGLTEGVSLKLGSFA
jgi:hypothetical protein